MATNLDIEPGLLNHALRVSDQRTRKGVVTQAPREFVARREQVRLLELFEKLEWDTRFDYKKERSRR